MFNLRIVGPRAFELCDSYQANVSQGYKGQGGWDKVLGRYHQGQGTLLDMEFLQDGQ